MVVVVIVVVIVIVVVVVVIVVDVVDNCDRDRCEGLDEGKEWKDVKKCDVHTCSGRAHNHPFLLSWDVFGLEFRRIVVVYFHLSGGGLYFSSVDNAIAFAISSLVSIT